MKQRLSENFPDEKNNSVFRWTMSRTMSTWITTGIRAAGGSIKAGDTAGDYICVRHDLMCRKLKKSFSCFLSFTLNVSLGDTRYLLMYTTFYFIGNGNCHGD
jgi:hypothetical protein